MDSNIVITGATGVVGRRAVRELVAAGHRVTGVVRSPRGRRLVEGLGAQAVDADVFDHDSLTSAFAGAGAVVNLLTHIPGADRMATPGAWDENDRLRREASAAIARAAEAAGAHRLVQESLAFLYADGGDRWLDDAATAVAAALRVPAGIYNVVDADPPTRAKIDAGLAAAVGRDALRPALDKVPPEFEPIARSQRVSSRRLHEASGWTPRVRGGTDGWQRIA